MQYPQKLDTSWGIAALKIKAIYLFQQSQKAL